VHDAPCDTVCHPLSPLPPPAPALASPRAPRSYGKDGLWLKVQPLCEKVYRQVILPPHPSLVTPLAPFPQILECASASGHGHAVGGGGAKFRDDAMALLHEVRRSFMCSMLLALTLPPLRTTFLFVACWLLLKVCVQYSHNCLSPPIQARMATGRGSGGLDDSICEDDI
jgi:hypothetical protein